MGGAGAHLSSSSVCTASRHHGNFGMVGAHCSDCPYRPQPHLPPATLSPAAAVGMQQRGTEDDVCKVLPCSGLETWAQGFRLGGGGWFPGQPWSSGLLPFPCLFVALLELHAAVGAFVGGSGSFWLCGVAGGAVLTDCTASGLQGVPLGALCPPF